MVKPAPNRPEDREPKPPFPRQHQDKPGLESELDPRPNYQAPLWKDFLQHLLPDTPLFPRRALDDSDHGRRLCRGADGGAFGG